MCCMKEVSLTGRVELKVAPVVWDRSCMQMFIRNSLRPRCQNGHSLFTCKILYDAHFIFPLGPNLKW
jgi:hypothetical protein